MVDIYKLNPDYSSIINEGSFGDIYKCKENNNIAIKLTSKYNDFKSGEENKRIINNLNHPNIMKIYGINNTKFNSISMVFMEYLNGPTFREYIKSHHNLDNNIISNFVKQILEGLDYLHSKKITHRDIKFDNILIVRNTIKIVDFGLAYYGLPCKNLVGTSGFFAPEMIYSKNNYDTRCDIWSLGCMIYYLVNHFLPFSNTFIRKYYIQQLEQQLPICFYSHNWNNFPLLLKLCQNMLVYQYSSRFYSYQCLALFN